MKVLLWCCRSSLTCARAAICAGVICWLAGSVAAASTPCWASSTADSIFICSTRDANFFWANLSEMTFGDPVSTAALFHTEMGAKSCWEYYRMSPGLLSAHRTNFKANCEAGVYTFLLFGVLNADENCSFPKVKNTARAQTSTSLLISPHLDTVLTVTARSEETVCPALIPGRSRGQSPSDLEICSLTLFLWDLGNS